MRFTHMADCHIGGWRDPRMKDLPLQSFIKAIDESIEKNVDFILISGDLFNTSHPPLDNLKIVVKKLKEARNNNIPIYIVAGSHDFSATGKTIIDVLEEAGLVTNVVKGEVEENTLKLRFTIDPKTGAKITGMLGKKGSLEKKFYEKLDNKEIEKADGFKIFMFHTSITELKPKELEKMESHPISLLPKDFDYYAGGHVHIVEHKSFDSHKNVIYPGPIFPNSYKELETLKCGGYYLYEDGKASYQRISLYNVDTYKFDAENKTPETLTSEMLEKISKKEYPKTIVLLRIEGTLKSGKTQDIDFQKIIKTIYAKGAYFVAKNTSKLQTKEYEAIQVQEDSVEKIEEKLIEEQETTSQEKEMIQKLIRTLSLEKGEDEKTADYEKRISDEISKILGF